jgi:hypothetical protein
MMGAGDPAVLARLEQVRLLYADAGAIEYVQDVVREAWRVNRRRWAPEKHFDDKNTLGYLTSRTGNGGCWSAGSSRSACPAEPFQYGVDLAVCGLPRPAANLDQFDQSKEFERVGSDVSSCRGRRPQKVLAYLFDLKAGCLEGQD